MWRLHGVRVEIRPRLSVIMSLELEHKTTVARGGGTPRRAYPRERHKLTFHESLKWLNFSSNIYFGSTSNILIFSPVHFNVTKSIIDLRFLWGRKAFCCHSILSIFKFTFNICSKPIQGANDIAIHKLNVL